MGLPESSARTIALKVIPAAEASSTTPSGTTVWNSWTTGCGASLSIWSSSGVKMRHASRSSSAPITAHTRKQQSPFQRRQAKLPGKWVWGVSDALSILEPRAPSKRMRS